MGRISATLFCFPEGSLGDLDNIAKPILDALKRYIYIEDSQVERLVVQKFEPGNQFAFESPSEVLRDALTRKPPIVYVRLSDDPFEDFE